MTKPATSESDVPREYMGGVITSPADAAAVALNPASGPYGATTGVTVGPTWINAQSEGADMSGATFSDTALANAYANKIPSGGGGIFFPPGTPKFNGQQAWNTKAIFLRGSGRDITTLNFPTALGAGVPGIILTSAINLRTSQAENFTIKGAGITPLGGPKQGYGDGIRVDNPMLLRDIRAIRFDDGIVFNSPNGHITLEDVEATQNYYGVYDIVGTGDMFITDSDIGGNLFAGIACPGNLTLDHYSLIRTHLGFCPYGIYHEVNGAAMGFMNDCELIGARFEATGNVAIYDPNFAQAAAGFSGNTIINPGHSFSNTYKIAANPQDYAIKIGQIQGPQNFLIQGTSGFMAGSSGTIFVQALNGGLLIFGDNNVQLVTVGSGNKGFAGRWTRYGNIYANGIDATDTGIFKVGDTIATAVLLAKSNPGTGATTGFPYIPASAGAPTGVAGAQSGFVPMYYDTTNHKLWIYDGGWKGVVVA